MNIVIGLLIIAIVSAYVGAPFFAGEPEAEPVGIPGGRGLATRQKLERQKLDAYAAIKEAEFDHRMGKLSDADFAALRTRYSAQALEAIAGLEAAATPVRQSSGPRRPSRVAFCPSCGHSVPPRANFCGACGRSLKEAVA